MKAIVSKLEGNCYHSYKDDTVLVECRGIGRSPDATDWLTFIFKYGELFHRTVDAALGFLIQFFTLLIFAALVLPVVAIEFIYPIFYGHASAVNSARPSFFMDFMSKKNYFISWQQPKDLSPDRFTKLTRREGSTYDDQVAELMVHLCALAYEDHFTIESVLKFWNTKWNETDERIFLDIIHDDSQYAKVANVYFSKYFNAVFLVFKGTSPFNLNEWLADASIDRISAPKEIPTGTVHRGFFQELWDLPGIKRQDQRRESPVWENIVQRIQAAMKKLETPEGGTVPEMPVLWVTGHSLGAAMATLAISYFTNKSDHNKILSLGEKQIKFMGGYTFGSPRVGDILWASDFVTQMQNKSIHLFRVANANDIVTMIPLGFSEIIRPTIPNTVLDYCHVGKLVFLSPLGTSVVAGSIGRNTFWIFPSIVNYALSWIYNLPIYLPLTTPVALFTNKTVTECFLDAFFPTFLYDHFPGNYVDNIRRARIFKEGGIFEYIAFLLDVKFVR